MIPALENDKNSQRIRSGSLDYLAGEFAMGSLLFFSLLIQGFGQESQEEPKPAGEVGKGLAFSVKIGGKSAGWYRHEFTLKPDGSEELLVRGHWNFMLRPLNMRHEVFQREIWREGELQGLTSTVTNNGTRHQWGAKREGDVVKVRGENSTHTVKGPVWNDGGAVAPREEWSGKNITVLNAERGTPREAILTMVGEEDLKVGSKTLTARHWRIAGEAPLDCWFDTDGHLVRLSFRREGKLVEIDRER